MPQDSLETPMSSLRLLLALEDSECSQALRNALRDLGHQVCITHSAMAMIEVCRLSTPEILVADLDLPDTIRGLDEVWRMAPLPVIALANGADEGRVKEAEEAQVLVYLVKPVRPVEVQAAVAFAHQHFQRLRTLTQQVANLQQALDDRKSIERAQGLIIRRLGWDPLEALRRMRKLARNQNRKLRDIADIVLQAEETFGALEQLLARPGDGVYSGALEADSARLEHLRPARDTRHASRLYRGSYEPRVADCCGR